MSSVYFLERQVALEVLVPVMLFKPRGRFFLDPFCRFDFSLKTAKSGWFASRQRDLDKPTRSDFHFDRKEVNFGAKRDHNRM
jgi:hypothetical protein